MFETAHPDLSERRSTLRCLSTVQRIESLSLDASSQCSTPRLLTKAWCRVARSALAGAALRVACGDALSHHPEVVLVRITD
jgi:hypothetical protein